MSELKQVRTTQAQKDEAQQVTDEATPTERSEAHEETLAKTDELLDEIDEALEGLNAQEVAVNFRQKGGE